MRSKLKSQENVTLVVKKHWITLLNHFLFFFIISSLLLFLLFSDQMEQSAFFSRIESKIYLFLGIFFFVSLFNLIYRILDRNRNIWAITNIRVVDEWGVFSHNSKECPLDKINDVIVKQNIVGLLLNFGNIRILTAANIGETAVTLVNSPKLIKETISVCQDNYRSSNLYQNSIPDNSIDSSAPSLSDQTKECPFCSEPIKLTAKLCRYCHSTLDPITSINPNSDESIDVLQSAEVLQPSDPVSINIVKTSANFRNSN